MLTKRLFTLLFLIILCSSNLAICNPLIGKKGGGEISFISHIITNEEGVLLKIGDSWIVVDTLQATGSGMVVLMNGEWMSIEDLLDNSVYAKATWKCEVCDYINYVGISACAVCGTSRAPQKHG